MQTISTLLLVVILLPLRAFGHIDSVKSNKARLEVRERTARGWSLWQNLAVVDSRVGAEDRVFHVQQKLICRETMTMVQNMRRNEYRLTNIQKESPLLFTFAIVYPVPDNVKNLVWYDDIYNSRTVSRNDTVYSRTVEARTVPSPDGALNSARYGAKGNGGYGEAVGTGQMSPYPYACVTGDGFGHAIAIDIGKPVVYRLLFSRQRGLVAEFDIALLPDRGDSSNSTSISLFDYDVDPRWGFRSAIERYIQAFPSYYTRRLQREGIWMPFTPVNEVAGWQDFGFAIHETQSGEKTDLNGKSIPIAEADRSLGVASFQYTEPWDIQIPVDPSHLSYPDAARVAQQDTASSQQIRSSVAYDQNGQWMTRIISAPWFKPPWAISFTTSAASDATKGTRFDHVYRREIEPAIAAGLDGIYFDSLEFFWHYDLDYRPEHLQYARTPLTFSSTVESPAPALWNYALQFDMLDTVCPVLHAQGLLSMGNGFTWIPFSVRHLDILGSEFSWHTTEQERISVSAFRRAVCGQKPVVLLLNDGLYGDDFIRSPYDGYRRYFEESLFLGMYPSFFSADASNDPYWKNPNAYNTGRPFFKKYIPLIREINQQGWQPVTLARSSDPSVFIERFDRAGDKIVFFTVRNISDERIERVEVRLESDRKELRTLAYIEELVYGTEVRLKQGTMTLQVMPKTTYLLRGTLQD